MADVWQSSYMYGGYSGEFGPEQVDYDDVWTLSIPAFRWFRVYHGGSHPRIGHTCHVVGKRFLLSIGGVEATNPPERLWEGPDTTPHGIGIFDMSELSWSNTFTVAARSYSRPKEVRDWYESKYVQLVSLTRRTLGLHAHWSVSGLYPNAWDQPALGRLLQRQGKQRHGHASQSPCRCI